MLSATPSNANNPVRNMTISTSYFKLIIMQFSSTIWKLTGRSCKYCADKFGMSSVTKYKIAVAIWRWHRIFLNVDCPRECWYWLEFASRLVSNLCSRRAGAIIAFCSPNRSAKTASHTAQSLKHTNIIIKNPYNSQLSRKKVSIKKLEC